MSVRTKVCLSFKTKAAFSINHIDCFYDHIVNIYKLRKTEQMHLPGIGH